MRKIRDYDTDDLRQAQSRHIGEISRPEYMQEQRIKEIVQKISQESVPYADCNESNFNLMPCVVWINKFHFDYIRSTIFL